MIDRNRDHTNAIKLLIMGLDAAGKTSIIATLMRDFERLDELRPTTGIERRVYNFLGVLVSEWDLGGQVVYRKTYLTSKSQEIFPNTEILIFTIDIQEIKRYDEAVDFFKGIVQQLQLLNVHPSIFVFFHKFDPPEMVGSRTELTNASLELRNVIKAEIDYPNIEFYRTSIYDQQTLLFSMSKILLSVNSKSKVIEDAIIELASRLGSFGLVLIDDNSLIIGNYYRNKYAEDLMTAVTPYFLEVNEILDRASKSITYQDEKKLDDQMMIHRFGKYFLFKKFLLRGESSFFYLLHSANEPEFNDEEFQTFVNLIKEILGSF